MARNLERRPTHPRQVAMGRDRGSVAVPLAGCRTEPIPAQIAGRAERFLSAFAQNMNDNILYHALARLALAPHGRDPPFPLVSSASFGSARSRPGREAAKRTLDGEDRSGTIKREGKGGFFQAFPQG